MAQNLNLEWKSPGPVSTAFMASNKRVQILNGPVGSGKTTTCCMKSVRLASRQMRSTRDGIRKFKLTAVRDTYRQLWKTTLPSWWKRIPRNVGEFTGAENAPATHRVQFILADQSIVDLQVDFIAIGENAVEDVMRGYEPTAWYLNEGDLLARDVYTYARSRWGRYPEMDEGGPSWYGILMDCNAPPLLNWLYTDIFKKTPDDVDLFRQPSGFDPHAENIRNLIPNYYSEQAKGQPEWFIKRMLENVPGYSRGGKPVYPEFNDTLHVSRFDLDPVSGIPLIVGLDAGGTPAAVFKQRMPNGRWHIIEEMTSDQGTGANRFGDRLAQRLKENYEGIRQIRGYADPSAQYGADRQRDEQDWIEIVAARSGIRIDPAPTNNPTPRWEAVRRPLSMMIDGRPAFVLSPRCIVLREGFNSLYRFKQTSVAGADQERYSEEAEKSHPYSDVHDALQYGMSGGGEDAEIRGRKAEFSQNVRNAVHEHDWNPLGA